MFFLDLLYSEQSTVEEYMYFVPLDLDSRGLSVSCMHTHLRVGFSEQ